MTRLGRLLLIASCALSGHMHAQSSAEGNAAGLQFNLLNPGARSLGLGGAFTGLADDATASYANPAGLINMSRPEVSMEGRQWDYDNFYTSGGHVLGEPSNKGIDTLSGVQEGRSSDRVSGLSFLSVVYPRDRWAVALYRHALGNFRSRASTEGAFIGPESNRLRFFPTRSALALQIHSYGAAFAYKITDHVAGGFSVARYGFELSSLTNRYDVSLTNDVNAGAFYGPAAYDPANIRNFQVQEGRDAAVAWNAGLLWKPSHRLSVGAVYKKGSDFGVRVQSIAGGASSTPGRLDVDARGRFHIPASYGAGVTFRPTEVTMVSFDCNRIRYSALVRDFVAISGDRDRYKVSDGTELHAGFEYILTRTRYPIVLRVGAWRDPDHRIRYADESHPQSALFRSAGADVHYSGGFGLAVGKYYQIDVAVDRSRRQQLVSVSMVTRF